MTMVMMVWHNNTQDKKCLAQYGGEKSSTSLFSRNGKRTTTFPAASPHFLLSWLMQTAGRVVKSPGRRATGRLQCVERKLSSPSGPSVSLHHPTQVGTLCTQGLLRRTKEAGAQGSRGSLGLSVPPRAGGQWEERQGSWKREHLREAG